jgi:hypothetical protein
MEGAYANAGFAVAAAIPQGLIRGVREANRVTSRQLEVIAKALSAQAIPQSTLKKVHQDIGEAAQRSMLQAYGHRRGRTGLQYRLPGSENTARNKRYSGGKLRAALARREQVEATAGSLKFINTTILNKEARQWRRLNFGAGGRAGTSPRQFQVEWAGLVVGAMGLEPDPRPAFALPAGFWVEPGGGGRQRAGAPGSGEFYPASMRPAGIRGAPQKRRMTAGIHAANFLDAGVRRIADEFPKAYQAMYRELYSDKAARKKIETKIGMTMPAIRVQSTRTRSRAGG